MILMFRFTFRIQSSKQVFQIDEITSFSNKKIKEKKRKEKDEICTDVKNYIRRLESFSNPLIAQKTLL